MILGDLYLQDAGLGTEALIVTRINVRVYSFLLLRFAGRDSDYRNTQI